MSDNTLTFRFFSLQAFFADVRCRQKIGARVKCIGRVVGALLVCGRRLSLFIALASLLPFRLAFPTLSIRSTAARTRTNALTLDTTRAACDFRLPIWSPAASRSRPTLWGCGAFLPCTLAFPRFRGSATLRPDNPPRNHATRRVRKFPSVGCRVSHQGCNIRAFRKRIPKTKHFQKLKVKV